LRKLSAIQRIQYESGDLHRVPAQSLVSKWEGYHYSFSFIEFYNSY